MVRLTNSLLLVGRSPTVVTVINNCSFAPPPAHTCLCVKQQLLSLPRLPRSPRSVQPFCLDLNENVKSLHPLLDWDGLGSVSKFAVLQHPLFTERNFKPPDRRPPVRPRLLPRRSPPRHRLASPRLCRLASPRLCRLAAPRRSPPWHRLASPRRTPPHSPPSPLCPLSCPLSRLNRVRTKTKMLLRSDPLSDHPPAHVSAIPTLCAGVVCGPEISVVRRLSSVADRDQGTSHNRALLHRALLQEYTPQTCYEVGPAFLLIGFYIYQSLTRPFLNTGSPNTGLCRHPRALAKWLRAKPLLRRGDERAGLFVLRRVRGRALRAQVRS